jgi:hypothetical protein
MKSISVVLCKWMFGSAWGLTLLAVAVASFCQAGYEVTAISAVALGAALLAFSWAFGD